MSTKDFACSRCERKRVHAQCDELRAARLVALGERLLSGEDARRLLRAARMRRSASSTAFTTSGCAGLPRMSHRGGEIRRADEYPVDAASTFRISSRFFNARTDSTWMSTHSSRSTVVK